MTALPVIVNVIMLTRTDGVYNQCFHTKYSDVPQTIFLQNSFCGLDYLLGSFHQVAALPQNHGENFFIDFPFKFSQYGKECKE